MTCTPCHILLGQNTPARSDESSQKTGEMQTKFSRKTLKERDHKKDLSKDGKILFKLIVKI
jgi:hypothetical protein